MFDCGCGNPAVYYSNDFKTTMCHICGVIEGDNIKTSEHLPFVHLRVHTHYSFLKAISDPKDLINKAKEYNMPALAKTDFNNMCGAPTFVKKCVDAGIKPILDTEFDVKFTVARYPTTFIALNKEGYKSLVRLNTIAWCQRKEKSDIALLESDLIDTSGLLALIDIGILNAGAAKAVAGSLPDNMFKYFEINDSKLIPVAQQLEAETNIPIVITGNTLYTEEENLSAYNVALRIGKHNHGEDLDLDNWFKPEHLFAQAFGFDIEWSRNTLRIADMVEDYDLINKGFIVPTYKEHGKEYNDLAEVHAKLEIESWRGLYEKGKSQDKEYMDRLQFELDVMKEKGFSS